MGVALLRLPCCMWLSNSNKTQFELCPLTLVAYNYVHLRELSLGSNPGSSSVVEGARVEMKAQTSSMSCWWLQFWVVVLWEQESNVLSLPLHEILVSRMGGGKSEVNLGREKWEIEGQGKKDTYHLDCTGQSIGLFQPICQINGW